MKAKTILSIIISTGILTGIVLSSNSSALDYQTSADLNFTINPSITVSLSSSDLIIDELSPGTSSDSNNIVVNVLTNNTSGYYLSGTVGNSSYTSTSLINNANNDYTFTSLPTNASLSDLGSLTPGTWGYSYATTTTDDGNGNTSWNWSNYSGLPLYTNAGVKLSEKYTPSDDDISFKIAAYATNVQASGEYNNVINFTATAYPYPLTLSEAYAYFNKQKVDGYYTMQDMTPGICATATAPSELQVIDIRDDEVYHIGKLLDGRCWLLDNLRLDPTITELSESDTNAPQTALDLYQNGGTTTEPGWSGAKVINVISNFETYTAPHINNTDKLNLSNDPLDQANNWKIGVYYNFCAASANTYCYSGASSAGNALYDICPINWRIPTGTVNGEYSILYNNKNYNTPINYRNALHLPLSGRISDSIYYQGNQGAFWSSTRSNNDGFWYTSINSENVYWGNYGRRIGFSIRCIANNE